jgi:hypothetical protein
MRGEKQRFAPSHRVGAHQWLAYRPKSGDFFRGQIGKADRLARIDQRALTDEVLDLGLGARAMRPCSRGRSAARSTADR